MPGILSASFSIRRVAVECEREALGVVGVFPDPQMWFGPLQDVELTVAPESLYISAVGPLDLRVLFRAARPDVTVLAGGLDGEPQR